MLQELRKFHPDWFIEEIGIEVGHVHLHMVIPPKDAVAKVVRTLKGVTSAGLKEKFPHFLRQVYWDGRGSRRHRWITLAFGSPTMPWTVGVGRKPGQR